MDEILLWEYGFVSKLGWPVWACRSIVVLSGAVQVILSLGKRKIDPNTDQSAQHLKTPFRWFQVQYLSVYLTVMLADWLQGTNMYTLYASYGMDIGTLFLTGFLSSAIFGTFLGVYIDKWGRKLGCIVFCLLEIVINVLEHYPSMNLLLLGRVLGGISTSLLFSAFESWMVVEHRKRGFPESWLTSTFEISSWANGLMAIIAGIIAQIASDVRGDIGPFQLAIVLTFISLLLILPWRENFGSETNVNSSSNSQVGSIFNSVKTIVKQPDILCLGLSQSIFEGAMFTFVFMWVPCIIAVLPSDASLPTGLVFSSMMLAMMLGGMVFSILLPIFPGGAEALAVVIYAVAAMSMAVPYFNFTFYPVFLSFLALEVAVGMFYSCGGILRSKYYPDESHSSLMTVFRLPLNVIVVFGTRMTNRAESIDSMRHVFAVVALLHSAASMLQIYIALRNYANSRFTLKKNN